MSDFVAEIRSYILAQADITAIVGQRFYQVSIPQNATFPACAYQVGLNDYYEAHSGSLNLARTLMTIACVGQDYSQVLLLANKIKDLLNNFRGTVGSTEVQLVQYQDSRQDKEEEPMLYIIELDFVADIEPSQTT